MAAAIARLETFEAALVEELQSNGAWRALRQLDEREAAGQPLQTVDPAQLRRTLEEAIDASTPGWQALHTTRRAIAELRAEALRIERFAAAMPQDVADNAPRHEAERPRIKIKATSETIGVPGEARPVPLPDQPSAESRPVAASPPPVTDVRVPGNWDHHDVKAPIPAQPRSTSDLARSRSLIDALRVEAGPPVDGATRAAMTAAVASVHPSEPVSREVGKTPPVVAVAQSGISRLSALEADLDLLIGRDRRATPSTTRDDESEVEEAEVEIVSARSRADFDPEPVAHPARPAAPVALSIRLKQPDHEAAFDGENYEAYRSDVEEAEVEIIRPDPPKRQPSPGGETSEARSLATGRLLPFRLRD